MKIISSLYTLFFFVLSIFLFPLSSFSLKDQNLENEIRRLEKELYKINEDIQKNKDIMKNVKRLLILSLIKENLLKDSFLDTEKEESYFNLRERYIFYLSVYNNFKERYQKKERELQKLKALYENKIEESKKVKNKYYQEVLQAKNNQNHGEIQNKEGIAAKVAKIFDPLKGYPIKEGTYREKVPPGTPVLSPLSGKVKSIKFFEGSLSVKIENERCFGLLSGLSLLKVSLGEEVNAKEAIGEVGYSEGDFNLYYEIWCKR